MKKIYVIASLALTISVNAQYTNLHDFNSTMGASPLGSLITDGTYLYGMTYQGGTQGGFGVIFKIKQDGTGYDTLRCFNGNVSIDEGSPQVSSLIFDATKTFLYGMTPGPAVDGGGIFKIKPDGTAFDTLKKFRRSPPYTDGTTPYGSLISDGTYLYGMTTSGGIHDTLNSAQGDGTIFKIKFDGSGYTKLHDFDSTKGSTPFGDLLLNAGFLYGTTANGGATNNGTIFKIKPDGTGFDTLMSFNGTSNGMSPYGSLISDGTYLYGMTQNGGGPGTICAGGCGVIFKIKPDGTGFDTLMSFNGTNGASPFGSLISDGTYLYGMTQMGGGDGNIFKIKPDGTGFDTLMSFNGTNGDGPDGSLLLVGGCLYGMTQLGGASGGGTVFSYCLSNTTGITKLANSNEVIICPNPASSSLQVTFSGNIQNTTLLITDMLGNTVKQSIISNPTSIINIADLAEGIYNISISSNEGVVNKRVVIVR